MDTWNKLHNMREQIVSDRRSGVLTADQARDQYSKLQAIQQQFTADVGKAGKLPSSIVTGAAIGKMARGEGAPTIEQEILTTYTNGDFSGQVFANLHPRQLERIVKAFSDEVSRNPAFSTTTQFAELKKNLVDFEVAATASGKGITQGQARLFNDIKTM
jgi:hypothetical protein